MNAKIDPVEQFEWEAPALRPTLSSEATPEKWWSGCPEWCSGDGEDHKFDVHVARGVRQHASRSLRVRLDAGRAYYEDDIQVRAAHYEVQLVQADRNVGTKPPGIRLTSRYGTSDGNGDLVTHVHSPMHIDEARELVAVLQHFLRVAQA